jgi:NitT/TauT family transport system substrate-binding protein
MFRIVRDRERPKHQGFEGQESRRGLPLLDAAHAAYPHGRLCRAWDIQWVESHNSIQLFIDRKIDAFAAIPPASQELRDRKVGHTIVSSTLDRPWSQYYCCMLAGATDYVEKYPAATKRVLRAFLKAADICVSDPKMVAQQLVDAGFTKRYDYALQTFTELRYDVWREFDPDDSLRFYALRMREASLIKFSPQEIIANGTDWRFLDVLKRELKT